MKQSWSIRHTKKKKGVNLETSKLSRAAHVTGCDASLQVEAAGGHWRSLPAAGSPSFSGHTVAGAGVCAEVGAGGGREMQRCPTAATAVHISAVIIFSRGVPTALGWCGNESAYELADRAFVFASCALRRIQTRVLALRSLPHHRRSPVRKRV